jgi:hypothetical protein
MGFDLGLGLKTSAKYGHQGYVGYNFDPQEIFLIFCPFYAILGLFTPFYAILCHFMPIYAISTVVTKVPSYTTLIGVPVGINIVKNWQFLRKWIFLKPNKKIGCLGHFLLFFCHLGTPKLTRKCTKGPTSGQDMCPNM